VTWREDLRRVVIGGRSLIGASFRGVPFFVGESERAGGRRAVGHEYPFRDDPFYEDLGRKARVFRLDGYVLGDDYLTERDALLAALEDESGPGQLVHPYYGVKRAICTDCSVKESREQGGIATFSIEFAETPTQAPAPTEVVDAPGNVAAGADAAIAATEAELGEQYDVAGLPAFALASAETALTNAAAALQEQLAGVVSDTQELAALAGQVEIITAEAAALVRDPAEAIEAFRAAITGLVKTAAAAPGTLMDALFDAYLADLGPEVSPTTATRVRELANQTAMVGALRRVMAIEAARLAPLVDFETLDDAIAARDTVAAQLEEQAEGAGDTAYPMLVDLRARVLRAVPGGTEYARVITVSRRVAIPSLLLAYQLYGSVDSEDDILARNPVRNPAFVAGDLKVLSDE
jgi:prophage DNA circulation protein